MRAAAADVAVERFRDLGARGFRIAVEQRFGRDDDAGEAIAALPGLLVEESLLQNVRTLGAAEAFDGGHALAGHVPDRARAGFLRLAVDQHHAAAALLEAAA